MGVTIAQAEARDFSFDQIWDDIRVKVASDDDVQEYPANTAYLVIADCVRVAFIIDLCYVNGPRFNWPITVDDLQQWGLIVDDLVALCRARPSHVPLSSWVRIPGIGNVLEYYECDRCWTSHLLKVDEIRKMPIKGEPVIMIPCPETELVTGNGEWWGLRKIRSQCARMAAKPITPAPIVYRDDKWIRL